MTRNSFSFLGSQRSTQVFSIDNPEDELTFCSTTQPKAIPSFTAPLDHNRSGSEFLELPTYLQETNNVIGLRLSCFLFVRRSKLITFDYKLYVDLWSEKNGYLLSYPLTRGKNWLTDLGPKWWFCGKVQSSVAQKVFILRRYHEYEKCSGWSELFEKNICKNSS